MNTALPEVIASRVVINGPDGQPRIDIGLVGGEPAIRIFDSSGTERIRLGLGEIVDEDPTHAGLAAELRLNATDDGGEVQLSAANAGNASIAVSGEILTGERNAAGAWIEANEGRIEACLYDKLLGAVILQEGGGFEVRSRPHR